MPGPSVTETALSFSRIEEIAKRDDGSSFYLLDLDRLEDNYHRLRSAFTKRYGRTQLAYSFKTNYTPDICARLMALGCWAEVVSEMEYDIATRKIGYPAEKIVVNGPVHQPSFLSRALVDGALLNLDAWYLLEHVGELCRSHPHLQFRVGVRLTFPIEGGGYSRFGLESSEATMERLASWEAEIDNCRIAGFHSHFSNSTRSLASFRSRVDGLVSATSSFFRDRPVDFINVGGGFLGDMPESLARQYDEPPPGFDEYASAVAGAINEAYPSSDGPLLLAEPGTAVVANTMLFACEVVEVKHLAGRTLALVDASKNNVKFKKQGERLPIEIVRRRPAAPDNDAKTVFDIVGNTCIEKDVLCEDVPGGISAGDWVVFQYAGGYGHVLKQPFIHPCQPIYATENDALFVVKRRETADDILSTYR